MGKKKWVTRVTAKDFTYDEPVGDWRDRETRRRTDRYVSFLRSDGSERQYGCRAFMNPEDPDDDWVYETRSLSYSQFRRFYRFFKRFRRRRGFRCWSDYRWSSRSNPGPYHHMSIERLEPKR